VVMTTTVQTATEIRPFRVEIHEEQIDDLRRRIATTRWPSKELVPDASQGVQLAMLQALARYWAEDYDFGRLESRLNALQQFTTEIDGLDIHFIHVKSEHEDALPLIITHGWPGSVIEMLEVIGPLTDPTAHGGDAADAFDVVIPSLPGCGFSAEPTEGRWGGRRPPGGRPGPRPHRGGLGRADASPRLHPVRRPGRRSGCRRHGRDGPSGASGPARCSLQLLGRGPAGALDGRAQSQARVFQGGPRTVREVHRDPHAGLHRRDGGAPADDRLPPGGFT